MEISVIGNVFLIDPVFHFPGHKNNMDMGLFITNILPTKSLYQCLLSLNFLFLKDRDNHPSYNSAFQEKKYASCPSYFNIYQSKTNRAYD